VNPGSWRGKRVFLTGHTGFKGGWLALWLQRLGARGTGFALEPPTVPSLFELARVGDGMDCVTGDIRDLESLRAAVARARPELVFHLAAQALVRPGYDDPVATYATNVMGTINVLESLRDCDSVRAAVMVTSDKCYENREWVWGYRENEAMGGFDPYSSSKGCAELVTAAYRRSFFPPGGAAIASARAGNVIGGGDWAKDRLVPDVIRAFSAGQAVELRNPKSVRPWQHVLDPLAGYLALAERLAEGGTGFADGWNFGPADQDARPVAWVVEQIAAAWPGSPGWRRTGEPSPHEAHLLRLDCSKARALLDWAPRLAATEAVAWTVDWYRTHARGDDVRALTLAQIERFQGLCA